jgi:hypothetical protein
MRSRASDGPEPRVAAASRERPTIARQTTPQRRIETFMSKPNPINIVTTLEPP